MELDLFIPSLNLALEYQGEQHYENVSGLLPSGTRILKDIEKARLCDQFGYTLVVIPYWWNGLVESLAATIHKKNSGIPIDEKYLYKSPPVPETSPIQAKDNDTPIVYENYFMLGQDWQHDMDPTNWWLTQKYDGVRALWDGTAFYSRSGRAHQNIPPSFKRDLPNALLDGELWIGLGKFHEISSLLFRNSANIAPEKKEEAWRDVKFMVFDLPNDSSMPYEQRMTKLHALEGELPAHVKIVQPAQCQGKEELNDYFNEIVNAGGEGVMLREAKSLYVHARSASLRKMKWYFETEVRFVGIQNGQFVCEQTDGTPCVVQVPPHVLHAPPSHGTVITIKHLGKYASGPLRGAKYHGTRNDIVWADLVNAQNEQEFIF